MSPDTIEDYIRRIEDDLRGNILPFWIGRVVERKGAPSSGSLTNDLVVDRAAERGALLTSRILWTFSAAHARYRDRAYLAMADHAYDDLVLHFHDALARRLLVVRRRRRLGARATASRCTARHSPSTRSTEYHAATGRREPLEQAIADLPAHRGACAGAPRRLPRGLRARLGADRGHAPERGGPERAQVAEHPPPHHGGLHAASRRVARPGPAARRLANWSRSCSTGSSTRRRAISAFSSPRTGRPAPTGSPTGTTSRPRGSSRGRPTSSATPGSRRGSGRSR